MATDTISCQRKIMTPLDRRAPRQQHWDGRRHCSNGPLRRFEREESQVQSGRYSHAPCDGKLDRPQAQESRLGNFFHPPGPLRTLRHKTLQFRGAICACSCRDRAGSDRVLPEPRGQAARRDQPRESGPGQSLRGGSRRAMFSRRRVAQRRGSPRPCTSTQPRKSDRCRSRSIKHAPFRRAVRR